ncbi:hypothetical protein Y032_1210g3757 [Ancylostoma ceylanicum]|uniref:Uncharacterized protein n=1 Tax=Ancylostoma ceylanicum TaxID=53326 RepID=A0A016W7K1_9BILA|nr:hypothetical protein Y032_1210g3757 [Ancylostoma ceylanicum]
MGVAFTDMEVVSTTSCPAVTGTFRLVANRAFSTAKGLEDELSPFQRSNSRMMHGNDNCEIDTVMERQL